MQATHQTYTTTDPRMASSAATNTISSSTLTQKKVRDIVEHKRRLVEVPYTASLAHTMNALVANRVVAMPVAAPPGHWIGAGGSMIMESDKQTGAVRKHYIGMVTMLDILAHIAGDDSKMNGDDMASLEKRLSDPVSSIIGHCLEGLSLWTLNPNTSIIDCMEVFSKGIHRAMVPVDSQVENVTGVELVDSASSYKMMTQMDVIRFLKDHAFSELFDIVLSKSVSELHAVADDTIFAVTDRTRAIDAVRCLKNASIHAVPIVEAQDVPDEAQNQLINGHGRKLVGTFSATDIRGCPVTQMQSWLTLNVMDFLSRVFENPSGGAPDLMNSPRMLVTCHPESTLGEVMELVATQHVHRVWVVDAHGLLIGLVSLTDIIRSIRIALLTQ